MPLADRPQILRMKRAQPRGCYLLPTLAEALAGLLLEIGSSSMAKQQEPDRYLQSPAI